jgi:hypothetical protein
MDWGFLAAEVGMLRGLHFPSFHLLRKKKYIPYNKHIPNHRSDVSLVGSEMTYYALDLVNQGLYDALPRLSMEKCPLIYVNMDSLSDEKEYV